jgi:hypothetical protein
MSLRFIVGYEQGSTADEHAVLYCSTTGYVYGRAFSGTNDDKLDALEVGQAFLEWCERERNVKDGDIRGIGNTETLRLQDEFAELMREAHG